MARQANKRRKADDPNEAFVTVNLSFKRPVYDRLKAVADKQHRRISDQVRAFTYDGLDRTEQALAN